MGDGARFMEVIHDEGIPFALARIWEEKDRKFERSLKQRGAARRCPICKADSAGEPFRVFWFLDPAVKERGAMGAIAVAGTNERDAMRQGEREADEVFRAACGKGDRSPAQISGQVREAGAGLSGIAVTAADRAWALGFGETARTLAADYAAEYDGGWAGAGFSRSGELAEIELEAG